MTTYRFAFGPLTGAATRYVKLTAKDAREYARNQPGAGLIWLCPPRTRHWAIVANFQDGSVWNGQAQIVPSAQDPADDWLALAVR